MAKKKKFVFPTTGWRVWIDSDSEGDPDDEAKFVIGIPQRFDEKKPKGERFVAWPDWTPDDGPPGICTPVAEGIAGEATAKLLCAAPDMRDALADMIRVFAFDVSDVSAAVKGGDAGDIGTAKTVQRAREALAKAGGR